MRLYYFILVLVLSFIFKIQFDIARASEKDILCNMPNNQTLKIGCTYDNCGKFVRWGIKKASKLLNYNIEFIPMDGNISIDPTTLDGILIPGGADINPKYYTKNLPQALRDHIQSLDHLVVYTNEGTKRDPFEYNLLNEYFKNPNLHSQPILGICRGMQMLGVSQGIPMYVDIKEELKIPNRRYKIDRIHVTEPESSISSIMKKKSFLGVELHHQALRIPYFNENRDQFKNVNITGVSNNGKIAEVIEFSDRPVIGVQFHPEYTFGKVRRKIFKWFLNKACLNNQTKRFGKKS
jgi:putative glutamine amidotransferase